MDRCGISDGCIVDCKMVKSQGDHKTTEHQLRSWTDSDLYEASTHPFIVKIWLEETAEEAGRAVWRGHVTHVPSGERKYLKRLSDVTDFIIPYLEQMNVKLCTWQRVRQRVKCAKHSLDM